MRGFALKWVLCIVATVFLGLGCDLSHPTAPASGSEVTISLAMQATPHDVAGFKFIVDCGAAWSRTAYVPLHEETGAINGNGGMHYYSELFWFLPPGECHVRALPKQNQAVDSEECDPVEEDFVVLPGEATQLILWAQCSGDGLGAAQLIGALNDQPEIRTVVVHPGTVVHECETVKLRALAVDANDDPLSYSWSVVGEPPGASYVLTTGVPDERDAAFTAQTPGNYTLELLVEDDHGGQATQLVPVTVLDDPLVEQCEPVDTVCCELPLIIYHELEPEECALRDGVEVALDPCAQPLPGLFQCCFNSELRAYTLSPGNHCTPLELQWTVEQDYCEPVCCQYPEETTPTWKRLGNCDEHFGMILPYEECSLGEVCCRWDIQLYPDKYIPGVWENLPEGECLDAQGGTILPDAECEMICCAPLGNIYGAIALPRGYCEDFIAPGAPYPGDVYPLEDCEEYCCQLFADQDPTFQLGTVCPVADRLPDSLCLP